MKFLIRDATELDAEQVVKIFNYFVINGFAAYPEEEVDQRFFENLKESSTGLQFLVIEYEGNVVGFGATSWYHPSKVFKVTAMLTYFLLPEYTGKGMGSELFCRLVDGARGSGIKQLIAHISSKNLQSLQFHQKHGFVEVGRLHQIGEKFGQPFDVVFVQKSLF